MFITKESLKDWTQIDETKSIFDISQDLVKVGLEEEQIHTSGVLGPLVLGKVLTILKEPQKNGKTINYCRVDAGSFNDTETNAELEKEVGSRGIICGAHNFVEGDFVVVSLPGAILPGGFEIAARKTYGHISNGMICSQRELGLGEDHDGIIVLNSEQFNKKFDISKLNLGDDLKGVLGLDEEKLEINITPDRSYCFSIRGVAREYSHSTNSSFKDLVFDYKPDDFELIKQSSNKLDANSRVILKDDNPIHNISGCSRFATQIVKGVNIKAQTPDWIKTRLDAQNIRSISLPVDITNYVMIHFGQPLHAYDLKTLNLPITVRRATDGEKLITIDQKERLLNPEDLVIADSQNGERAIGIAGVMGGFETEVSDKTTDILLESAYFEPVTISRSARRHKLPSEASKRYERGVDPALQEAALNLATSLLVEYGGGTQEKLQIVEIDSPKHILPQIEFNLDFPNKLLGFEIDHQQVKDVLEQIGCEISSDKKDSNIVIVTPPSWRTDLNIKEDLVEEVARLVGYDKIPQKLPAPVFNNGKTLRKTKDDLAKKKLISNALASRGWVEVISYPFTESGDFEIKNPLTSDRPYMRTSLLDTLIPIASLNIKRGNCGSKIFEIGLVYQNKSKVRQIPEGFVGDKKEILEIGELKKLTGTISGALPDQNKHIAGIYFDTNYEENWFSKKPYLNSDLAWLQVKEISQIILNLSNLLPNANISFEKDENPNEIFHPVRVAKILVNKTIVGIFGELSFSHIEKNNLPKRSCAFEIDLDVLTKFNRIEEFKYQKISLFPPAHEDYAFIISKNVNLIELTDNIKTTIQSQNLLADIKLFDVFESEKLGDNFKSVSVKVKFFNPNETISTKQLNEVRNLIISNAQKIGAQLRK